MAFSGTRLRSQLTSKCVSPRERTRASAIGAIDLAASSTRQCFCDHMIDVIGPGHPAVSRQPGPRPATSEVPLIPRWHNLLTRTRRSAFPVEDLADRNHPDVTSVWL